MTEELLGRGDPVIRRLQQAFADEELTTDLAAIMHRAANYQAGQPSGTDGPPPPGHGLTQTDLVAARRREPAAVTRLYSAYAPALFRFFMASVGDRHLVVAGCSRSPATTCTTTGASRPAPGSNRSTTISARRPSQPAPQESSARSRAPRQVSGATRSPTRH
jgi:hypothetical protein